MQKQEKFLNTLRNKKNNEIWQSMCDKVNAVGVAVVEGATAPAAPKTESASPSKPNEQKVTHQDIQAM